MKPAMADNWMQANQHQLYQETGAIQVLHEMMATAASQVQAGLAHDSWSHGPK
jgi:hypothetical protein